MSNYNFITDRLAIGNVASRATPGFCAVVSILATDRPGTLACEVTGAPEVPNGDKPIAAIAGNPTPWRDRPFMPIPRTMVLRIDLADGESHALGPAHDRYGKEHPSRGLEDYLDDATSFIAAHIRRGCVLVHCGAGKSRSVAVVIAYLCRYAGMSYAEAAAFVAERRPGACPAPCFAEAVKRWLQLDELAMKGPREAVARRLTELSEEMVLADLDGKPSPEQPAWQKPILARPDDFQAPPRSPIVSIPAPKPAT